MMNNISYSNCTAIPDSDFQIEAVLTPLLFHRKVPDHEYDNLRQNPNQPDLKILDLGCGHLRLLNGIMQFPRWLTGRLHYVGAEPDTISLKQANFELEKLRSQEDIKNKGNFLKHVQLMSSDEALEVRWEYDYVHIVNVLHHVAPTDLPGFWAKVLSTIRKDGFLVIHDFFLGDYPDNLDTSLYCDNCIFFGPREINAILGMAAGDLGFYRIIPKRRGALKYYLYTYSIQNSGEIWGLSEDGYYGRDDIIVGFSYALSQMNNSLNNIPNASWYTTYGKILKMATDAFDQKFNIQRQLYRYKSCGWLSAIERAYKNKDY